LSGDSSPTKKAHICGGIKNILIRNPIAAKQRLLRIVERKKALEKKKISRDKQ